MKIHIFGFGNTVNINTSDLEDDLEDELFEDISELESLSYAFYKSLGCPLGNTSVGLSAWIDKQNTEYQEFCDDGLD